LVDLGAAADLADVIRVGNDPFITTKLDDGASSQAGR
jgi:hypothetical protein